MSKKLQNTGIFIKCVTFQMTTSCSILIHSQSFQGVTTPRRPLPNPSSWGSMKGFHNVSLLMPITELPVDRHLSGAWGCGVSEVRGVPKPLEHWKPDWAGLCQNAVQNLPGVHHMVIENSRSPECIKVQHRPLSAYKKRVGPPETFRMYQSAAQIIYKTGLTEVHRSVSRLPFLLPPG